MNTINLVKYIRHGMIFKNLAENKQFDAIVYESYDNQEIDPPTDSAFYTLRKDQLDVGVGGRLHAICEKHERILIVIDNLPVWYLLPMMSTTSKQVTIVNLNAGLSGLPSKGVAELQDIMSVMSTGWHVGEAFDFVSLFGWLEQPGKNYIRIPNKEYIGNLLPGAEDTDMSTGLLDCTQFNVKGEHGTILCGASLLPAVITALSQDGVPQHDLFGIIKYDFARSEELQESLEKTKRLLVIVDQGANTPYRLYLKGKLWEAGIRPSSHSFITPKTEGLTATQTELLYEQASFAPTSFVDLFSRE